MVQGSRPCSRTTLFVPIKTGDVESYSRFQIVQQNNDSILDQLCKKWVCKTLFIYLQSEQIKSKINPLQIVQRYLTSEDWFVGIRIMCPSGATCLPAAGLLSQWAINIKTQLNVLVWYKANIYCRWRSSNQKGSVDSHYPALSHDLPHSRWVR
jgi:hypothetical protein